VTLVGYLGFLFLAMLVMSTLRINLTSLTWVVSALSVGIGFGLQQIVQNFISGLILLTERPVKVGDWVSLAVSRVISAASTCAPPRSRCPTAPR
jgi:small-conductance mechanosensitive channel